MNAKQRRKTRRVKAGRRDAYRAELRRQRELAAKKTEAPDGGRR